ncbi:MAG TPA: right-handed parallel beta-helix repeat-containing protein [bacterium]|nr:right-handed parallel beta-helix repeat-containing protein [bacterium]
MKRLWHSALILTIWGCFSAAASQPTGGPYGPIRQNYALPATSGRIFFVAPEAPAGQKGTSLTVPMRLEEAIAAARTGDAIILRGGTYRTGGLKTNQGILLQPYADEVPILKGTRIATDWQDLGNGLWTTKWTQLFPARPADWWRRNREGKSTPLWRFNNDMVFVDGRFLQAAGWEGEVDDNHYYIDYDNQTVYICANPAKHLIEITAWDCALLRTTAGINGVPSDGKGYTLRGITFTQYAYRALEIEGTEPEGLSPETNHGKMVTGTTLEDCTISFCSRVAGYLRGDHLTLRRCRVSDTSTEGVYIIASNDVLLEKNIFTRNNIEMITGYYPAAVKIFNQCYRVVCRDNLVTELPWSNGIWYDVGNVDGVFVNNWVEGVGHSGGSIRTDQLWPSDNGFFFEISKGAICAGNLFINCDHGLMVLNSRDVQIYNNTFVNSTACIGRNGRSAQGDHFGWHPSTGPDVDQRDGHILVNNLFTSTAGWPRPLLFVWQPADLCARLGKPMLRQMSHNVFVQENPEGATPLVLWSPAGNAQCQDRFFSLDEMKAAWPGFATGSLEFEQWDGPLFRSRELRRFEPDPAFPGSASGIQPPAAILRAMRSPQLKIQYTGAWPAAR